MNYKVNNARTAAVATDVFWKPIDEHTPTGVRMLLINKRYGTATIGQKTSEFTHWAPLPKWADKAEEHAV
jgi:hypothetical protein